METRRAWDSLLPLLIGMVIGLLSSYAIQSGRLATLETTNAEYAKHFERLDRSMDAISSDLTMIRMSLAEHDGRTTSLPIRKDR